MSAPTSATASRSSLGPLTTTYAAPALCSIYGEQPDNGDSWQAQGCSDGNVVDTSSCWPPALVSAPNPPYGGWGFYSPGLVCPSGYVSACGAALNSDGSTPSLTQAPSFSFQFPLVPGETATGCCPPGFTCYGTVQTCLSIMTSGSYLAGICQSPVASLTDLQYITIPGTNTVTYALTTSTATLSKAALFAPLFQLNWQSKDLPTTTTSSPSSSLTGTASTSSPTATVGPTPSSGLSTGATIAIAVVIPVVVIAIAGVLACRWFRRRRQNRASAVPPSTEGIARGEELQPHGEQFRKFDRRSELEASPRPHELQTVGPGSNHKGYQPVPQELEASGS